jgi:hypothetical protein
VAVGDKNRSVVADEKTIAGLYRTAVRARNAAARLGGRLACRLTRLSPRPNIRFCGTPHDIGAEWTIEERHRLRGTIPSR